MSEEVQGARASKAKIVRNNAPNMAATMRVTLRVAALGLEVSEV
jgi:hypothetical protein